MKDTKFLNDLVVCIDNNTLSREAKIDDAIDQFSLAFDIQKPMWFNKNTKEMAQFSKTHFYADQFIEHIGFDYFEIEIIEEDKNI